MMFTTRHYLNQRTNLDQTVPFNAAAGHKDFPQALLIPPGFYKGYIYNPKTQTEFYCALNCTQPGLYQIFIPLNEGANGSLANIYNFINASTPLGLASAVATLHAFGTADSNLSVPDRIAKLRNSPLSMQCGESASVFVSLAQAAGYEARLCAILTQDPPNYFNDGHMVAEAKVDGRWVMFDTSLNFVACHPSDNMLSLADACEGVWAGTTEFFEIAPFQFDALTTVLGAWNSWGWCLAGALYDDTERATAAKRLYRIPLIQNSADGHFWGYLPPGAEQQEQYALSYGHRLTTKADFVARFYA